MPRLQSEIKINSSDGWVPPGRGRFGRFKQVYSNFNSTVSEFLRGLRPKTYSKTDTSCRYNPAPSLTSHRAMAPTTTKVALVTGAAGGLGRVIALRLAEDGFDVAVNDISGTPKLDGLVQEIESKGQRSLGIPADVSLESEVETMVQKVVQELGSLDVVSCLVGGTVASWCLHVQ